MSVSPHYLDKAWSASVEHLRRRRAARYAISEMIMEYECEFGVPFRVNAERGGADLPHKTAGEVLDEMLDDLTLKHKVERRTP